MQKIRISDPTLRDGNHAVGHTLNAEQIAAYCTAADAAHIPVVEVGHGNGIGASSLQLGMGALPDREMLTLARGALTHSRLGIHVIPGFATIKKDLEMAVDVGVDVFRLAAHCTEADITERHIAFARAQGKEAIGVLMMSHMASKEKLLEEGKKMESYGAQALMLMDSAGAYLPADVTEKIGHLVKNLSIPVGFHAHNNLGLAIANSVAAVEAGALMLDGTARALGAGAGNAQLEVLVAVLHKMGYETGIDLDKLFDAAELAEEKLVKNHPRITTLNLVSGLTGVFSGFVKHVERAAKEYNVSPREIFFALGKRGIVAGQEDIIIEVAMELAKKKA